MHKKTFYISALLLLFIVAGCTDEKAQKSEPPYIPWVKTVSAVAVNENILSLSGIVKARYESPLAFQVGGRILSREVDAGANVEVGEVVFTIDPRDLEEELRVTKAQVTSAKSSLTTAASELKRYQSLYSEKYVGKQELERVKLAKQEAISRFDTALANLERAKNARSYTQLTAPSAGVILDTFAEPGQVVPLGYTVAILAQNKGREIEVSLPEKFQAPQVGEVLLNNGQHEAIELREISGAADNVSRSWRARYRLIQNTIELALGSIVKVDLAKIITNENILSVPLSALDERGKGPRIWIFKAGKAIPVPINIVSLENEIAKIQGDVSLNDRVIALGTHLLIPNMAVRELR